MKMCRNVSSSHLEALLNSFLFTEAALTEDTAAFKVSKHCVFLHDCLSELHSFTYVIDAVNEWQ